LARLARDTRRRESDARDGGGDFHELEIEKHFEQSDEKIGCEWTFEREASCTVRPGARVDAQARSEVHGETMNGPTCAEGRRATRSSP